MFISAISELIGQGVVIGAQLISLSAPSSYPTSVDLLGRPAAHQAADRLTPGAYVILGNGVTAGLQRNPYHRSSVYAGYTVQDTSGTFALTVGGTSGYATRGIAPFVAPSVRIDLNHLGLQDASARLSLMPTSRSYANRTSRAATLQLSIEVVL